MHGPLLLPWLDLSGRCGGNPLLDPFALGRIQRAMLGLLAREILDLFVQQGPTIFWVSETALLADFTMQAAQGSAKF
jgi:hypothetical protein